MTYEDAMKQLEAMGTAQNRKVYPRHGVKGPMFGVSYADLGKLQKAIKTDHDLAPALWKSGNHDARVLAVKIADPSKATEKLLDSWIKDCDNYIVTDAVAAFAGQTAHAAKKSGEWIQSKDEWIGAAGWILSGGAAMYAPNLDDALFERLVDTIESGIHTAKNRVKHSMIMALICIGARNAALEKKVTAAVKRIGPADVDHGETGCKTPEPLAYIQRMKAHRAKMKVKSKPKAKVKAKTG